MAKSLFDPVLEFFKGTMATAKAKITDFKAIFLIITQPHGSS